MNSRLPQSGFGPATSPVVGELSSEGDIDLTRYVEALIANRWLIVAITALVTVLGVVYAMLQRPIYATNMVVQVEESEGAARSTLGEAGNLFELKTPAAAEMEIIRSRNVIGAAVDAARLHIDATPRYAPYVGGWLARRATELSEPGFLGMPGYVTGTEQISVSRFDLPPRMDSAQFTVVAQGDGRYSLKGGKLTGPVQGQVGTPLAFDTSEGRYELLIDKLAGKPGAEFFVTRLSRQATIGGVQGALSLYEVGKQSGIINVGLQGGNPSQLVKVLNAIGEQYVQQNVDRRAAEARKALAFLDVQLPVVKRQLEQSEDAYNRYRNQQGTVSFTDEATNALAQSVERQTRLFELQQKRTELQARFTNAHPLMQTLDAQIAALKASLVDSQTRIKALPAQQQEAVRLERDVKVNTELYQSLLNNAMQLRLVKEGKVGNVRVLDEALEPGAPFKPQRKTIVMAAVALGLFLGVVVALVRNMLVEHRIREPHEVEVQTGLAVFSTIPTSKQQGGIAQRRLTGATGVRLLAIEQPDDPTVESLRSLRT
ncbi:MAG: tyrosine protein kinase, partial [Proteobacteria bacterium]|nr:tyrosine protein kinase [Pseudomonadota bacterium]